MKVFIYLFLIGIIPGTGKAEAAIPTVVATIKPLHSLVCGVMKGAGVPVLLMQGYKSPHIQSLGLQEVGNLQSANLIFWIGKAYETPLYKIIKSLEKDVDVVTLMDQSGLAILPNRQGELWGNDSSAQEEKPDHHGDCHYESLSQDGHIWLDPHNAQAIVKIIAQKLAALDPQHKTLYFSNSEKVIGRLQNLDLEMQMILKNAQGKPYIIYHDGMQYFDRHFGTNAVGALIRCTHSGVNARHLIEIDSYMKAKNITCVFSEPQYAASSLLAFARRTGARVATVDYLGAELRADENAYFTMMRQLASSIAGNLQN